MDNSLTINHVIDAYAYGQLDALPQADRAANTPVGQKWSSEYRYLVHAMFQVRELNDETGQLLFFTRNAATMWDSMMSLESFEVTNEKMDTEIVAILRGE